ncbi:5'-deoxyadenosine deaminase [uncultured Mailhella sp.]|uniref:5'-deoxyadenosine deaminase n=1 Tax=uncultured Mailhella sp. TaxID=1981031 RepID=UPI0025D5B30D|nr:5'-deoxyadenosine deaminase [uncultured Mailhella sp.]
MKTLFLGGMAVTMDKERRVLCADILVDGDCIASVRPHAEQLLPPEDAEVVDVRGKVVIPGLVQAHMHVTQALFRGLCDDLALMEWLRERTWPLEAAHTAESNAASARLAAMELIRSGTTSLIDMGTTQHEDAIFEVMAETGLRGLFGKCMMDEGEGLPAVMKEDTDACLKETERLIRRWHMAEHGRLRYAVAPRFVPSCSQRLLSSARDMARQNGLRLHTHASENLGEIRLVESLCHERNVLYLHRMGYTGRDVVLAHCIWLDEEEKRLLAETGTHVAHCPSSNLKLASGIAPVAELAALGAGVGIGLDGAHNHMDGLEEVRRASLLQKALTHDPKALPAMQALEMATLGGAAAMGQEEETGSLEEGRKADLVVLDMDMPHSLPACGRDIVQRVVYQATRENVLHTMVDGKFLYRDRVFLTLDEKKTLQEAEEQCALLMRRAGLCGDVSGIAEKNGKRAEPDF